MVCAPDGFVEVYGLSAINSLIFVDPDFLINLLEALKPRQTGSPCFDFKTP